MVYTNFHDRKIPKEGIHCVCLSIITIDCIIKMLRKFYSQVYLEECKYVVKKNKMTNFIGAELQLDTSDDSYGSNSV